MVKNTNKSKVKIDDLHCYKNPKTKRKCSNNEYIPSIDIRTNVHYLYGDVEHLDNNNDNLNNIEYCDNSIKTNKGQLFESYVAEYEPPNIRIIINTEYLKEIVKELKIKDRIFTRRKISELIGISEDVYQRVLYKGYRLSFNIFNKFKALFLDNFSKQSLLKFYKKYTSYKEKLITHFEDDLIPHKKMIGQFEYIPLEENEDLAEFMCIMCGDGHLSENSQTVMIALNPVDEEYYTDYTISMICYIFNLKPDELYYHEIEGQNTLQIILRRKSIHFSIVEKGKRIRDNKNGLIPGNKVDHQVGVPDFILKNYSFIRRGLKGLFDTDGGITVNLDKRITLNFENYSDTLLHDFHNMCHLLGINSTYSSKSRQVNITEVKSVKNFLDIVKPEKFKEPLRRIWLACKILKEVAPVEINEKVEQRIKNFKLKEGKLRFSYSRRNTLLIKQWLEVEYNQVLKRRESQFLGSIELNEHLNNYGFSISEEMTNYLIGMALTEDSYTQIKLKRDIDEIYNISNQLLYFICEFTYESILNSILLNDDEIILNLIKEITKLMPYDILLLLRYRTAFMKYAKYLIIILREIIRRSDPKIQEPISPYYIIQVFAGKGIQIPFKYTFLRKNLIPFLKTRYPRRFWYVTDYK